METIPAIVGIRASRFSDMIHHKKFNEWSHTMQQKLRKATFGPWAGMMYHQCDHNPDTFVLLDEENNVISWSLVTTRYFSHPLTAMFYTQPESRRKGFGRMVAKEVKKFHPTAYTDGWDEQARKFFASVGFKEQPVKVS